MKSQGFFFIRGGRKVRVREGDVRMEAEVREKERERDLKMFSLALKMEQEATSQGIQVVSTRWKRNAALPTHLGVLTSRARK